MEPLIALALWSAITTAALVLSSSSVGAIVSEELGEELNKYFYKVVSSSKSAQGVGVARDLVRLPSSPGLLAAWTMFPNNTRCGCELILFEAPLGLCMVRAGAQSTEYDGYITGHMAPWPNTGPRGTMYITPTEMLPDILTSSFNHCT